MKGVLCFRRRWLRRSFAALAFICVTLLHAGQARAAGAAGGESGLEAGQAQAGQPAESAGQARDGRQAPSVRTAGQVLRVAFPRLPGLTDIDENGERCGIVVDYLDEIAKYTGWKYEYIDTAGEAMIQGFMDGQYDLMGGTYYQKDFEKYFAYPDYNTGHVKSVLLARRDDERIKTYDWKSLSGLTIGVYDRAYENVRRLKIFLDSNAIECKLKYYTNDQFIGGELYQYLENGEVDMLLGNYGDDTAMFRVAAEFDSQPIYIVTRPECREVLDDMNMAMKKIVESNPDFAEECYGANYPDSIIADVCLNEEERDYVKQKKVVSVAVVSEWHPFLCPESKDDLHKGIIPDVLEKVKEFSGLEFQYVYADNYEGVLELVSQGKADMAGAFLGTAKEGGQMGFALTKPYTTLNDIVARNKSVTFPSDGLTGAVVAGRKLPKAVNAERVLYFPDVQEALRAVNQGEADFYYGLSATVEREIQKHHFTNIMPNIMSNDTKEICFAVVSPAETELFTILNKAVNSLSSEEQRALADQNMVSLGTVAMSITELIYANPVLVISVSACVFLLVVVLVVVMADSRIRAAKMQGDLERAESASRAKGEFLSRMSHEIRTPMNAIVGLSDLTCMVEGAPEQVRDNLQKIRASSRYLLQLISDILDMSRIENGMLTIAGDPFSMSQAVTELEGMLEEDARRRGLEFTVEKNIGDQILLGDAVRLKQVLTNLVSNAFKFTPAGGQVRVGVSESGGTPERVEYHFWVADNGVGISEDNQKRIFEAFEQVGSNYSKSQGTGLGLAISKNIVELMGGELKLKSRPGEGSKFEFTVSFQAGILPEEKALPESTDLERMHILLAEDNDLNAEIAQELLGMKGAMVSRARNGLEAVEMFRGSAPGTYQAILMDIQMPVMDGLEACRAIRKLEREDSRKIPVIAMTANSFKEDADAAKAAGMDDFITKPVDVEYLYQVLSNTVGSVSRACGWRK